MSDRRDTVAELYSTPSADGAPGAGPRGHAARRVARGGPIRLAGYGIGVLMSLATAAITLRHLGVSGAGELYAGLAALAVASSLSDLGLAGLGLREYSTRPPAERAAYLARLSTARCLLMLLAVGPAIALVVGGIGHRPELVAGLLAGALAALGTTFVTTAAIPFTERLDPTTPSLMQVVQSATGLLTTTCLVLLDASVPWFFAFQLPGVALAVLLLRLRDRRLNLPWPRLGLFRSAVGLLDRSVLTFGVAVILGVAFYRAGPLALTYLSDTHEAGLYGSAFRLADVVEAVAPLLMTIVLPLLATGVASDRLGGRVRTTLSVMAPLGTIAAASTFGAAAMAVRVVGGPEFEDAVAPLRILSVVIFLAYPTQVYGYALLAEARYRAMLLSVLAALAVTAGGLAILTQSQGAAGAAVSLAFGQAVLLMGYLLSYSRRHSLQGHARPAVFAIAGFTLAALGAAAVDGAAVAAAVSVLVSAAVVGLPGARAVRNAVRRPA